MMSSNHPSTPPRPVKATRATPKRSEERSPRFTVPDSSPATTPRRMVHRNLTLTFWMSQEGPDGRQIIQTAQIGGSIAQAKVFLSGLIPKGMYYFVG